MDARLFRLPVVAQRLHVNVNSGWIGSGSALGEKNKLKYHFHRVGPKVCSAEKEEIQKSASLCETDLQADGQVDPGAEGGAHST